MLYQFEQKKTFYDFLKKNAKVEEINVNNHLVLTITQIMKQVQPYIAYIDFDEESMSKKEELFDKLKSKYNFCLVDIDKIIANAKIRKLIDANAELSLEEKINLIRPIIFREECSRIILIIFGRKNKFNKANNIQGRMFKNNFKHFPELFKRKHSFRK